MVKDSADIIKKKSFETEKNHFIIGIKMKTVLL